MNSLDTSWKKLQAHFKDIFDKEPNTQAALFLIGVQVLGDGYKNYKKQQKHDLIHVATCAILSLSGYYEFEYYDEEGWPHWKLNTPLPPLGVDEQENMLKEHIILYCKTEFGWEI